MGCPMYTGTTLGQTIGHSGQRVLGLQATAGNDNPHLLGDSCLISGTLAIATSLSRSAQNGIQIATVEGGMNLVATKPPETRKAPKASCKACAGTQVVGNYELTSALASGEQDCLYVGKHRHLGTKATIRLVYPSSNKAASESLVRESRIVGQITHPNILGIKDCGITPTGIAYVVMGYWEGKALDEIIKGPRRSVTWCLDVVSQMAEAMAAMHAVGLTHGQLQPNSFRLVEDFPADRVMLTDFGLAVGKSKAALDPKYMSPEQCKNAPIDVRSDVYTLGCILYELLTGEALFSGSRRKVLKSHQRAVRTDPRKVRPDIRPKVASLLKRMLSIAPNDRPPSMNDVARRLGRLRFATGTNSGDLGYARTEPMPSVNTTNSTISAPIIILVTLVAVILAFIQFSLSG